MKFHKNLHVVALFAAMFALNAQAAPVSSAQVMNAVSAWASVNGSAFDGPGRAVSAEAVSENGTNLYWIVRMSKGGAVIASPDTDLDLVVAVLEKFEGSFPKGHPLPAILRRDMLNRLSVLGASPAASAVSGFGLLSVSPQSQAKSGNLPEDVTASVKAANAQWAKYSRVRGVSMLAESLDGGDSSPYVRRIVDGFETGGRFTHWNQGNSSDGKPCYNYYVPYNEVCGCVATAGAAIMQFFGCVEDFGEVGSAVDDTCSIYGKAQPDRKTISGAIDWSILPKSMGGNSDKALDEEGRKLLGRITHNIGTMVGMSWATLGPGGESGAYLSDLSKVFGAYAAVDGEGGPMSARSVRFSDVGAVEAQYFKMVYAQNWAGAPVLLGISGDSGGHAVVACGYAKDADGDEFCRVFMGWGGSGDAWYVFPEVQSYNIVDEAVTMIGYDCTGSMSADDVLNLDQVGANRMFNMAGTVPVCGKANVTNTVLTLPGVTKSAGEGELSVSFTLTVNVDSNGYFAVRIPRDTTDLTLKHEASGVSIQIAPFNAKVLAKGDATCAQLCDALPDELLFMVLNMTQCTSVEVARAVALRDGKALLMISGDSGSVRTDCLLDGITELDSKTDLSNRFVMVFTPVSSASVNGVDGNPSVGVFDPADGSADLRWWEWNGRLSYTNFVDYVDDDSGEIVYTIDGSDLEAAMSAMSNSDGTGVLDIGYDTFLRRRADAIVTVSGVDLSSGSVIEAGNVSPAYGEVAKAWTNCEEVVFSAPSVYTNENKGVIYECAGWTTNEVFGADGVARYNPTNAVSINLAAGDHIAFTWVWTPVYFRVRTTTSGLPPAPGVSVVSPAEMWAEAFSRATVSAENALGAYGRKEWVMRRPTVENGDYKAYYDGRIGPDALVRENGSTLSFFVFEPVDVCANYAVGATPSASEVKSYTIVVTADSAEAMDAVSLRNGYGWGTNTVIDPVAYFAPAQQSYTDATGGVWVCTGWEADGVVVDGSEAIWELSSTDKVYEAKCLWTLVPPVDDSDEEEENEKPVNPDSPDPDVPAPDVPGVPDVPDDPVPVSIAFSSVSCEAGGWTVVLTNGVKGCWYHLYATNELSAASADWPYAETEEANPQQAAADGPVVFRATGSGNAMFWRARATAKETDD